MVKPFDRMVSSAYRNMSVRDVILVEIFTDEGITGVGFLTGLGVAHQSESPIIKYCIDKALRPMIVGQDPFAREHLWKSMFKNTTRFGRKGAMVRAISGVDIALWDIAGKAANMPCYKLIGYNRTEIPVYASGGHYAGAGENDLDGLGEEIRSYVEKGFQAIKIKVGRKSVREDLRRVAKAREVAGDRINIMVDANLNWNINDAVRFCDGAKELNLYFVEEPLEPDDYESYKALADRTNIPIAAGESEYTKYGFLALVNSGVRVIQPDVCRVGGVTEWLKAASLGQCWNLCVVPHGVQEIHVTCCACSTNAVMTEYFTSEHPLQQFLSELFVQMDEGLRVVNGTIRPLDVPGMGLLYDPTWLRNTLLKFKHNSYNI
jgi:D-arabinonate dehydratase